MTGHPISITGVSKIYGAQTRRQTVALEPVDLELVPGEFFSLVGPSGCGKSTLLNIVSGLLDASGGQVRINGRQVKGPDRSVGIVFQRPTLLGWLTLWENVCLPSKIAGGLDDETKNRARQLLDVAGLADFADRYPEQLSGGMQQRGAIVRALTSNPSVLLMDEPFSALDEFTRETLNDELLKLWEAHPKTVIFVTHNLAEAVYLSDRVGVMSSRPGRLSAVVDVDLPRPRSAADRSTPTFHTLVDRLRSEINQEETPMERAS